jgi:hypothetical protein
MVVDSKDRLVLPIDVRTPTRTCVLYRINPVVEELTKRNESLADRLNRWSTYNIHLTGRVAHLREEYNRHVPLVFAAGAACGAVITYILVSTL